MEAESVLAAPVRPNLSLIHIWLIKEGYEPLYGARPMRRIIQRAIGDPLSEELIKGRFKENRKIKVVLRDGAPAFIEQEAMAGV